MHAPPTRERGHASNDAGPLRRRSGGRVGLPQVELVALAVLAGGEPAVARDRRLGLRLATQLPYTCAGRVDVAGVEVVLGMTRVLAGVDGRPRALTGLRHPVVHLGHPRVSELPAEDAVPELLRAVRVLRDELDVNDLSGHGPPPRVISLEPAHREH